MNRKGQALVEFVLILPIFMMILFVIIDMGMIYSNKSKLENTSSDIINLLNENYSIAKIEEMYSDVNIKINNDDGYKKIVITSSVDLITPGLNLVIDDPYIIKVERVIVNETK